MNLDERLGRAEAVDPTAVQFATPEGSPTASTATRSDEHNLLEPEALTSLADPQPSSAAVLDAIVSRQTVRFDEVSRLLHQSWPQLVLAVILIFAALVWRATYREPWSWVGEIGDALGDPVRWLMTAPSMIDWYALFAVSCFAFSASILLLSSLLSGSAGGVRHGSDKARNTQRRSNISLQSTAWLVLVLPGIPLAVLLWWGFFLLRQTRAHSLKEVLTVNSGDLTWPWRLLGTMSPMITGKFRRKLAELREPTEAAGEPFLVVRNFHSRIPLVFRKPPSPTDEQWSVWHFNNARTSATLFELLGCFLRFKHTDPHARELYRDYVSNPKAQKDRFSDGDDLPLRFRQSSSELHFHTASGKGQNHLIFVPKFTMYSCMHNAIGDPVYVLPVAAVVARLAAAVARVDGLNPENEAHRKLIEARTSECFNNLGEYQFFKQDKFNLVLDGNHMQPRGTNEQKPIIQGGHVSEPWRVQMAWDSHKIVVTDPIAGRLSERVLAPIAYVITAIQLASAEARRVVLNAGDVLIIDNLRALVCRREYDYRHFFGWGLPVKVLGAISTWPRRWLRLYYGFPI